MKKHLQKLSIVAALCLAAGQSVFAGDQDFTLHNKTGVEIHQVFVSAHETDNWEEDILGKDTLPDDNSTSISFSPKEEAENWDIKIVDGQGDSIVWENLKLTEITDVTLYLEDGKAWAETKNGD